MKRDRLCITLVIVCLLGLASPAAGSGQAGVVVRSKLATKVNDYMGRLADHGFSGVLLVAKEGEIVLEKGYGLADREHQRPFGPDTVVSIGSITKQFTAAAILKLEMQGKLKVSDPISKHFTGVPQDKAGINLHHLLTHSAGLESEFGDDFDAVTRDEIVRRALASKLRSPPGKRYHYSNASYSLLAAVVELVSGQGYEVYLQEILFKPAGMTRTGYRLPRWKPEELAQGYQRGQRWGTVLERPWAADGPYWNLRGNGGIHTTAGDMFRWHRALEGEVILSQEAKQKLYTPHISEGLGGAFYGYGWSVVKTRRGTRLIEHNGGDGIFFADFKRYLDDGIVVFIASNDSEARGITVSRWLDRLLFGGDYPTPPKVVALEPARLAKYAGSYKLPGGGKLVATVRAGQLVVGADGRGAFALLISGRRKAGEPGPLEARTADIFEAMAKGDYGPLHKALGGGRPLARVQANQTRIRQQQEAKHGPYQGFEVIGSAPAGELTDVYVRLKFARGTLHVRYGWEDGQLVVLAPVDMLPGSRAFRPQSPTEFAAFDFATGSVRQLQFATAPDGKATGLTVRLKEGDVRAQQIEAGT